MSDAPKGIVLTRQVLYDQIWREPMTKVANKYGLSDVCLSKICKKFDIPRPPVGYWARLVAGKAVDRPALPDLGDADKIEIRSFRATFETSEDAEPLVQQPVVVVSDELVDPHPVVKRIKKLIQETKADSRGILESEASIAPAFAIAKDSVPRALRILDAVYKHWVACGGVVRVDTGSLGDGEDFVDLSITESYRREENPKKDRYFTEWIYIPTGKLALEIKSWCRDGMRRKWADGKSQRLEDLLGNFIGKIPLWLAGIKANRLDRECRDRQRARAQSRRQAAKTQEDREKAWRDDLLVRARDFETASRIRRYLAAVEKAIADGIIKPTDPEGFRRWIEWSHWYADFADPSVITPPRVDEKYPPENTPVKSLDLTTETRSKLTEARIRDTDELYAKSKRDIDVINRHGPYAFHHELEEVLEGLGYDMAKKDWVTRYSR